LLGRLIYWVSGFLGVAWLAGRLGTGRGDAALLLAAFAAWVGLGLLGEARAWRRRRPVLAPAETLLDSRPADGRVEIVPVAAAVAIPNAHDGRFGRLERLDAAPAALVPIGPTLRGRVLLASFFLGRDGHDWTDHEIAQAHKALFRAGAWVGREAAAWEQPVHVALACVYASGRDDRPRPEAVDLVVGLEEHQAALFDPDETAELVAAFDRTARASGSADLADFLRRFAAAAPADRLVWLAHVRARGRSHWVDGPSIGLPILGLAVCFANEDNAGPLDGPPFADPVTFVHELMHAFGATDKYGASARQFGPGQVGAREVMLLHEDTSLARLRVDPLTAREIGWHDAGPLPAAIQTRSRRGPVRDRGGLE
jgi:hypothetical protein